MEAKASSKATEVESNLWLPITIRVIAAMRVSFLSQASCVAVGTTAARTQIQLGIQQMRAQGINITPQMEKQFLSEGIDGWREHAWESSNFKAHLDNQKTAAETARAYAETQRANAEAAAAGRQVTPIQVTNEDGTVSTHIAVTDKIAGKTIDTGAIAAPKARREVGVNYR